MAESKKVLSTDVIEQDLFRKPIESTKEFEEELDNVIASLNIIKSESVNVLKEFRDPKTAKEIKTVTNELDKFNKAEQAQIKLEIEREKLKQAKLKTDAQILAQQKKEEQEKAKQLKQQEKELENLKKSESAYNKASKQLNELRQKYKDLAVEGKGASREAINYLVQITKLDKELKDIDASVGQFNRSVGDYSNQVQDAIEKTGFFGDIIAKITSFVELFESVQAVQTSAIEANTVATEINTGALELNVAVTEAEILAHEQNIIALQAETVATEKLSLAKRVLNAITSPVGLILLGAAALAALAKEAYDVNQALQDQASILKAQATDFGSGTKNFENLTKATISYRKEVGKLQLQLQELEDTQNDLTEIANDETLALGIREKAYKDAQQARIDSAKKNLEIIQREKDLADLAVKAEESRVSKLLIPIVGKNKALQEFYDKQIEAQKKLFDANDRLGDLERTNAEEQRKFNEKVIVDKIELIRSKKLGADSQVEILKKQVDDENKLIEQRKKALQELTDAQLKAQTEEIKLLQEFGLTKIEIENLIAEKDAVKLARELDELGRTRLSIAQKEELAKVVLESQKNELDRSNQQAKIDQKEIQNQATLLKLKNEVNQITLDDNKRKSEEALRNAEKNTDNSQRLALEDSFNSAKRKKTIESIKKERELQAELSKAEEDSIKNKYKTQEDLIKKQIENKEIERNIGIEELKKLEKQKQIELEQTLQKERDLKVKQAEFLAELQKKQTQEIIKDLQTVTQNLSQELDNRNQLRNDNAQKEIDKNKSQIDKQRALAEKGSANQLAFEESQLAKRELQQQQALEKQARQKELIQLGEAYLSAFNARLTEVGGDPNTAPIRALGDVLLAKGISKGLVQFAKEGNEMVMPLGVGGKDGVDDIPFMLTKHEAVIPKDANLKHHDAVKSLIDGSFDKVFRPVGDNGTVVYRDVISSKLLNEQNKTNKLLQELVAKPVQQVDVDSLGNIRESIIKETQKVVITHKKRSRI